MADEKSIDESWKESVTKEKDTLKNEPREDSPQASFNFFVTTLAIQASIFLGQMPNPATNQKEENIPQAKFIIDTLDILKEKTKGNLTKEESQLLENIIYELKMQYVSKTKGDPK
ncbi:MAG: DUF1844 domain-containing protein [Candidatus Omnitrophica bacterium]|nr:DUF1844 domain-containing protein [Candidatus Omnitrophota bacterium]